MVKTLAAKGDPNRYQSQITLAKRRIVAFTLAAELIQGKLEQTENGKEETKSAL